MYSILIVQLGGNNYFWVLNRSEKWLAISELIGPKKEIVAEAEKVAKELKIENVLIDERS